MITGMYEKISIKFLFGIEMYLEKIFYDKFLENSGIESQICLSILFIRYMVSDLPLAIYLTEKK